MFGLQIWLFLFFAAYAPETHAGLFSDIWKFLVPADSNAEEISPAAAVSMPLLGSQQNSQRLQGTGGAVIDSPAALQSVQDSALVASRNPAGTLPLSSNNQILIYTVQDKDTPSGIAKKFDITLNTLLWANNIRNANLIKTGDEVLILPIDGIPYEANKDDTFESIAKKFNGDANEIRNFNGFGIGESIKKGTILIVPNVEMVLSPVSPSRLTAQPSTLQVAPSGYYARPIIGGRNVRATRANPHGLHGGDNAVDLASPCGTPIYAAVKGKVVIARTSGWSGGLGKFVTIEHQRGTVLFAHMSIILVVPGQLVERGKQIGAIGSTGNSTGCHVHFGILGGDANLF